MSLIFILVFVGLILGYRFEISHVGKFGELGRARRTVWRFAKVHFDNTDLLDLAILSM